MNNDLWINKHSPLTLGDIKGNSDNIKKAITWINTYSTPRPEHKILLLSGPPGTGKTTIAKTIATACNIEYELINCSSDRTKDTIKEKLVSSVKSKGILGGKLLIILDEIDGQKKTSEIFSFIPKILKININPIIATCNNTYKLPTSFISDNCNELKFRRQYDSTVRNILMDISLKEGFKFTTDEIDNILIKGDIRASISALQIYAMSGYKIPQIERDKNIFTETRSCLLHKTELLPKTNLKDLIMWIEENGTINVNGLDRYYFYNILIESILHLSNYRKKEAMEYLSHISFSRTFPQDMEEEQYIKLQKPSILTRMMLTKNLNKNITSLSLKICPDYAASSKDFFEFIFPILQQASVLDINFARFITNKYNLEKEEISLLLDTNIGDPRINKCLVPDKTFSSPILPERNIDKSMDMLA